MTLETMRIASLQKWIEDAIANREQCIRYEDLTDEPSKELKMMYGAEIRAYKNVIEAMKMLGMSEEQIKSRVYTASVVPNR